MNRYPRMFAALERRGEGALVPFLMLGDPDPDTTLRLADTVVEAGADALELGVPFSDPIADGPVIQQAAGRALRLGVTPARCFELVASIRARHPSLPLGLLVYANLVEHRGVTEFYREAAHAGADSILVADVPLDEAGPLIEAARAAGVAPVFLLPHDADAATTERVARAGRGYTYVLGRAGVTGNQREAARPDPVLLSRLREAGGAPPVVGFGVSRPAQVRELVEGGAAGVVVGSALVAMIARHEGQPAELLRGVTSLVREMKLATRGMP